MQVKKIVKIFRPIWPVGATSQAKMKKRSRENAARSFWRRAVEPNAQAANTRLRTLKVVTKIVTGDALSRGTRMEKLEYFQ